VKIYKHVERILRRTDAGDVVDVRVRQKDVRDRQVVIAHGRQQPVHFVSGINENAFARALTADDISVFVEGRFCADFKDHSLQSYR